jgi:hypothetical protein
MLDKWASVGHHLGECWVDNSKSLTYINIPKNASSYMKACLMGSNTSWTYHDHFVVGQQNLVLLRDPIDRWCSGMAQSLFNSGIEVSNDSVFNHITFDDHTELQTYFLQGVDLTNTVFFLVNDHLTENLTNWSESNGNVFNTKNISKYNASSDDNRANLKQRFLDAIANYPEYMLKLKKHFADDYNLINQVEFYGN